MNPGAGPGFLVVLGVSGRVIFSSDHATQTPATTCQATTWMWLTA
jgi:hypothetical protein